MTRLDSYECRRLLGTAIREGRAKQGLSLRRFAAMVGIDYTHLFEIEYGKSSATIDLLVKIANGLDVSVRDLIKF